jgi:3-hydroxy-9,10-secoandrosta-1,3,5(10)-triene-9,17-dione monooxygenase
MNAPLPPRPDFSGVDAPEALRRAAAMVPVLRERAVQTEQARRLLPQTEADLHANGLLRFVQPRRWGGMELDFRSLFEIPAEIGRGCPSTAWSVANLAIHHWMLALYGPEAQQEVWGEQPDALIASGIAYPQGRAVRAAGGVMLSGRWNFSSGVDGSHWNMLAAIVREGDKVVDHVMCLVPRSGYTIVDDWHVLGMRGTGSKTVEVKDLFVPAHRALSMYLARGDDAFPGARVNDNPLYRVPLSAMATHCIAGAAVGNAQCALELSVEAVKARSTNYMSLRMRDFQAVQLRVAEAGAKIHAARLMAVQDCVDAQAIAAQRRMPTPEEKLRFKRNVAFAVQMCTEAVDTLHVMAGANGVYDAYPIQRCFRDAHSLGAHIGFSWDAQGAPWGLVAMGGSVDSPTL